MLDSNKKNHLSPNNHSNLRQLVVIGAGGHAVSVANIAISAGYTIKCFVDKYRKVTSLLGFNVICSLEELKSLNAYSFSIAIGDNAARERIFYEEKSKYANLHFPSLIHSSATICSFTMIEEGTVIMPKAVVGPVIPPLTTALRSRIN
jgi:hypothetical protein